ncbi:response regulator [cf. Phormidesmis sp. LEGE 11477]|uniref:response regulator n=1 Tax=cf. Phormidesmis sp. LEGE 11477 TaxID=1828680 RepID=UPI00187E3FB6|nr:response regulator [cf. Phormidesmis sp. LEGE 11477]MBE9061593.1 response regulator [cf. Phormidesmis sp. LEGE 11477]
MRILLVEDDESVAKILHKVLTDEHYTVDVAHSGHIGWQLVSASDYNLIILDVLLPELDGIEFCRQLRAEKYTMPVLFVTALDASSKKIAGFNAGADDYITKPFELEELLARVRALLRRVNTSVVLAFEWENLRLEVNSRELTYRGQQLLLTPKEHAMVELFLRNPGQVFSRQAIIDNLWSYSDAPGEETVTSHIKGLRRKLKNAGAPADCIETVYGVGYRLKPLKAESLPAESPRSEDSKAIELQGADSNVVEARYRQTKAALATLWKSVKCQQNARLAILQQAREQIQTGSLAKELRKSAYRSSHSLAGVLGIFGFTEGSECAKQIQLLLEGEVPISPGDRLRLVESIEALEKILDEAIAQQENTDAKTTTAPLLVLIDPQLEITSLLVTTLWSKGVTVKVFHQVEDLSKMLSFESANTSADLEKTAISAQSERILPDVVLLESSFSSNFDEPDFNKPNFNELESASKITPQSTLDNTSDSTSKVQPLSALDALLHRVPSLMLLICSADGSLSNRVKATQLGDYLFFCSPDVARVVKTIELLRSHPPSLSHKILAVDDDPQILQALQTRLAQRNYQVVTLDEPLNFWETLQAENPDLLLLDISMPQFTGIELCQTVRQAPDWRHLPIVFFTANTDKHLHQAAFRAGANNLIEKSLPDAQLLAHLSRQMKRSHIQQAIAAVDCSLSSSLS